MLLQCRRPRYLHTHAARLLDQTRSAFKGHGAETSMKRVVQLPLVRPYGLAVFYKSFVPR